jgi:hypothetical protein
LDDQSKVETERIRNSVVCSFDKYAQRHTERYLAKLKSAPLAQKELLRRDFYKVDSLLSKRVFIPGFYVYVLKKTLENELLMRQRTVFIKASLISLFNQEGVRVRDVAEKPQQPLESKELKAPYTRRQTQRFFKDNWQDSLKRKEDNRGFW